LNFTNPSSCHFYECTTGLKAALENIGRQAGGNGENCGGSGSDESLLELDRKTPHEEQTHFLHVCHHRDEAGVKVPWEWTSPQGVVLTPFQNWFYPDLA
jgi:hypothetical protein